MQSMKNSILTNLASINATIVGIIIAVLVAFFIYSFQTVTQVKEQLNDLRKTTAKIMFFPASYWAQNIRYSDYIAENKTLDYERIKKELLEIEQTKITVLGKVYKFNESKTRTYDEIKKRAAHYFDLFTMISDSSLYTGKFDIKKKTITISPNIEVLEYNSEWQKDLINLNGCLVWIWGQKKDDIMNIFLDYEKAYREKEISESFLLPEDYKRIILSFFNRVYQIQANVIPQIKDLSYKLNLYQEMFEMKKYVIITLAFAIYILTVGVFFPLLSHLYFNTPHKRRMEVFLLCATILPYLIIIIILLNKAIAMEFR